MAPKLPYDASIAVVIDHTLLKPDASGEQIRKLCREANDYGFASVCINPIWVELSANEIGDSPVKVCTVIGFPLGAGTTAGKLREVEETFEAGAREFDMVMNPGLLKSGYADEAGKDIAAVVRRVREPGDDALVKVIIETCLLTREEMILACSLVSDAGADFIKTSTGFSTGGATVEDVELLREHVTADVRVKASGGIRSKDDAIAMIRAGADRIGASASIAIVSS